MVYLRFSSLFYIRNCHVLPVTFLWAFNQLSGMQEGAALSISYITFSNDIDFY